MVPPPWTGGLPAEIAQVRIARATALLASNELDRALDEATKAEHLSDTSSTRDLIVTIKVRQAQLLKKPKRLVEQEARRLALRAKPCRQRLACRRMVEEAQSLYTWAMRMMASVYGERSSDAAPVMEEAANAQNRSTAIYKEKICKNDAAQAFAQQVTDQDLAAINTNLDLLAHAMEQVTNSDQGANQQDRVLAAEAYKEEMRRFRETLGDPNYYLDRNCSGSGWARLQNCRLDSVKPHQVNWSTICQ
jgi:hypothetical protein